MKPGININQFFSPAYVESKINFCVSLIARIKTLKEELDPQKKKPKPKNINEQRYPTKLAGSKNIEDKENMDDNIIAYKEKTANPQKKKNTIAQEIFSQGLQDDEEIEHIPKFNVTPYPGENVTNVITPVNPIMNMMSEKEEVIEQKTQKKPSKQSESGINKDILKMIVDINTVTSKFLF